MKNEILLFSFLGLLFFIHIKTYSQNEDSVKNYWLKQIEINEKKINLGELNNKISKDNLENIFDRNGFHLIRKGVFFAQDIYVDGLKKGDLNVVIDGERYHSACPNRMDSPLTRINPLDLETVDLVKGSTNIQSGLGGVVMFNRSLPSSNLGIKADLSTVAGSQKGIDFSTSSDFKNHRISLRYSKGSPYKDGENNSFADSYNFKENYDYQLAEISFLGGVENIAYGGSFSYTDNVSFPYLLMDERYNRVFSAHLRYNKHKVYFNYTDHMMDNDLRINTMLMRTSVTNLTIGAIGDFYEVVYRNWNAENFFNNPMINIQNDLMPDVSNYMLNLFKSYDLNKIRIHGKAGFSYQTVGKKEREEFYKQYFNDVKLERFFPIFSAGISYSSIISNHLGTGIMLEVNSESPETESLFIAVKKPGTKPAWSGNPNLNQPIKAGLRGLISFDKFNLEFFATQVWDYNNLTNKKVNDSSILTFENVDAILIGSNLNFSNEFIEFGASYTWAKNTSKNSALAEISPLSIRTKLLSPQLYNFIGFVEHTYNDAQLRIDETLNESTTAAWNKLDIGISYLWSSVNLSLEVENLLNTNYYQHLSYLRDPFSSGSRVFEPGRTFRITFKTSQLF
ncbi:MAG: hypothetical protein H6610_08040 [Ignavibacteriales bacterium]|nr:hypothetical protein [Ignavibacteriales bacterium]